MLKDEKIKNLLMDLNEEQHDEDCDDCEDDCLEDFDLLFLNTEELKDVKHDKTLFQNGVNSVSELCGKISALMAIGVTPELAISYFQDEMVNDKMIKNNLEIAKISSESDMSCAKIANDIMNKNSL